MSSMNNTDNINNTYHDTHKGKLGHLSADELKALRSFQSQLFAMTIVVPPLPSPLPSLGKMPDKFPLSPKMRQEISSNYNKESVEISSSADCDDDNNNGSHSSSSSSCRRHNKHGYTGHEELVLEGVEECDLRCLQFLRARDFVIADALSMYVSDFIWRVQNNVDGIVEEQIESAEEERLIAKYWPVAFTGHDKFGRPILFENTGDMDIITLMETKQVQIETLLRYHIKQQEYLKQLMVEASVRFQKPHDSLLIVMDIKHASLKSHLNKYSRELFSSLAQIDQVTESNCIE